MFVFLATPPCLMCSMVESETTHQNHVFFCGGFASGFFAFCMALAEQQVLWVREGDSEFLSFASFIGSVGDGMLSPALESQAWFYLGGRKKRQRGLWIPRRKPYPMLSENYH